MQGHILVYKPLGAACNPSFHTVTLPLLTAEGMSHTRKIPRMSGNRRMDCKIPYSILARLASRSVTGRDPPPQVHQQGNLDFLVVWGDTFVRRRFVFKRELGAFCSNLLRGR
jgi:hypothetical protein